MKSKVACLIASLSLAYGLIGCSSNTNSQSETAATTTASEIDNIIECQYLYFPTKNCKQSTSSSSVALSQNISKPKLSSSLSTTESSIPNLVSNILSNSRTPLSPPNQLYSNPAIQPQNYANLTPQPRRFSTNSNLINRNTVTQLPAINSQVGTSNYNLDYRNNNQATSSVVANTPTIEFSQPTVVTELTTNELQPPSSRSNNLAGASQTQMQQLSPPRNLQLPSEQLNAELTTNNVQQPIPSVTAQQVSNNQINSGLSNNDSQPSLPTSSNLVNSSVNQPEPQLNTNQLQPELNFSSNQVNLGRNTNQIQEQFPGKETTLQVDNNQPTSPENSDLSNNSGNLRPQLANLQSESSINFKPEFGTKVQNVDLRL